MESRQRILNAAIPVFAMKGRYRAHIEDIASLAHINKAMIYYIFNSKDELYLETLKVAIFAISESTISISEDIDDNNCPDDYVEAISKFISREISFLSENMNYTRILVDAMISGGEEIQLAIKYYKDNHGDNDTAARLLKIIEKGKSEKFIRDVDTDHFILNMIGMILIYFFSQSINEILDIEVKDERRFLEDRTNSVIDLVLNGILAER